MKEGYGRQVVCVMPNISIEKKLYHCSRSADKATSFISEGSSSRSLTVLTQGNCRGNMILYLFVNHQRVGNESISL